MTNQTTYLYVGSYTRREPHVVGKSQGIYVYKFDLASGHLTYSSIAPGMHNPSFLTLHPQKPYLYAVHEIAELGRNNGGAISAFAINPSTGALTELNHQHTEGGAPCHLVVDASGQHVLAANYGGGSVCVMPIEADGRLGPTTEFIQHKGGSVDPQRQDRPHAHSIMLAPDDRFAVVPDLGMDKVMIYQFDRARGKLIPNDPAFAQVAPGGGPRHFDFHPDGKHAYVINEMGSTITAFNYDAARGALTEIQTISTLPSDFSGHSHCADIHVHPSGKFVYGSNRGHDSIAIFAVDTATGKLTAIGHESTQGKIPRNFALDPTGSFLLAANQNSDTIVVFRIDPQRGKLTPTGHITETPTPVCLKFWVQ